MRTVARWSLALAAAASVWLGGCASMTSVGDRYAAAGRDEVAVYYYAGAWRLDQEKPEPKNRLVQAIKAAARKLDMRYATALEQKKYREALGIATRKEELYLFAQRSGLEGFMPEAAGRDAQRVAKQSAQEAVRTLDASTDQKLNETDRLRLAREALALNPDDPDLTSRYETMRTRLERRLAVKYQGPDGAREETIRAAGRILGIFTGATRELFAVVPESSGKQDMELQVAVDLRHGDSGWRQTGAGKAKGAVQQFDKFNEVIHNDKGEPALMPVHAVWQTFERTRHLDLGLSVTLVDLRARKVLFSQRIGASPRQTRRYYTYQGDERALQGREFNRVTALGKNSKPPEPVWAMLASALPGLTEQHAKVLLDKLEYR